MQIYALDIETDNSINGLDPRVSFVRSVAVYGENSTFLSAAQTPDTEGALLAGLAEHLDKLEPGVVVTWNGAAFDIPFICDRYTPFPATLVPDPSLVPKYDPLPGHQGAYRIIFARHHHLDIAYHYKDEALASGLRWSLKPIAHHHGIEAIEIDAAEAWRLSVCELLTYNLSDAIATYRLAELKKDVINELPPVDWI